MLSRVCLKNPIFHFSKYVFRSQTTFLRPNIKFQDHHRRFLTPFLFDNVRLLHQSRAVKAPFWKLGTNVRIFKNMLQENGNSQWRYRLVLCVIAFTVLNFLFNVMLTILTERYLETIQRSSWKFGFSVNSEFRTGIVNEVIKFEEEKANENYYKCIKSLAKENGLIDDEDSVLNIQEVLLGEKELNKWFFDKRDLNYISVYCDLLLRYALTLKETQYEDVTTVISRAFEIIDNYEKLAHERVASYDLKNKALRIQAEMMKFNGADFVDIEKKLYDSVCIVIENEYKHPHPESSDICIVPSNEESSNNLTNTLLELAAFYAESRTPKNLNKALSILLAELRSLEIEYYDLNKTYDSDDLYAKKSSLSLKGEKRLMELKFERIPLINMQISEILWSQSHKSKAIELAKESAQVSSLYSSLNFNSAKIAKMGFLNLSTMYHQTGDEEASDLCLERSKEIEIPMSAFMTTSTRIRDVVLDHYFGMWGRFLFPG